MIVVYYDKWVIIGNEVEYNSPLMAADPHPGRMGIPGVTLSFSARVQCFVSSSAEHGRHLCVKFPCGGHSSNESVSRHLDKFETAAALLPFAVVERERR